MTLEQIKAEIKERLAQTNVNREEQASKVDVPDYFSGLFDGVANGFDQVLVLLDQLEPSFHPYPEEKPPVDSDVIVQWDDMTMEVDHYTGRGFSWFSELENQPVAWAELPKPYKEANNDH